MEGAALGATYYRSEWTSFHGTRADIAWTKNAVYCGDLTGAADLSCEWAWGQVHVESSGIIHITGAAGITVRWTADHAKPVFVNGVLDHIAGQLGVKETAAERNVRQDG